MCCLPLVIFAQMATVIPLASEPHHHLALHNDYVNVYEVEVAPHDSVQLHRHEFDSISIMMSNSEVVVRAPGKPDARQKLAEGQVRLQSSGYVHSTSVEGEARSEEHTSELQSQSNLVCRLLLEKKKKKDNRKSRQLRRRPTTQSSVALVVLGGVSRPPHPPHDHAPQA